MASTPSTTGVTVTPGFQSFLNSIPTVNGQSFNGQLGSVTPTAQLALFNDYLMFGGGTGNQTGTFTPGVQSAPALVLPGAVDATPVNDLGSTPAPAQPKGVLDTSGTVNGLAPTGDIGSQIAQALGLSGPSGPSLDGSGSDNTLPGLADMVSPDGQPIISMNTILLIGAALLVIWLLLKLVGGLFGHHSGGSHGGHK